MTIARVKGPGWAANEKLTSGQQNALDLNTTYALDKRAAQTDTLSSVVTVASGGAISMASGSAFTTIAGCPSIFNGTFRANGTARFDGAVTVNGNATFAGAVAVAGTLTSASQFDSTGYAAFTGATAFTGAVAFAGAVAFDGATVAADFTITGTNRVKLASRSIGPRTVCAHFQPYTSGWSLQTDSLGTPMTTTNSSQTGGFPLALPEGAVINQIRVCVSGAPSHSGAPAGLPTVALWYKLPSTGGTGVQLAGQTDVYGSALTYATPHYITMSGINHVVDRDARLVICVTSEYSSNALSGFEIHGVDVTYTVTNYDDGGTCN
jgi:hypothetical protein